MAKIRVNIPEVSKNFYVTVYVDETWRLWIAAKLINLACWILGANYREENISNG